MIADLLQSDADSINSPQEINVLASQADWDWPGAVRDIFRPRGVNLLVADNANDIVNVLRHRQIRTAIVDTDPATPSASQGRSGGLWALRIIRVEYPAIPCILLTSDPTEAMLEEALRLDVFSVIDKPVDMRILRDLLNRLFVKRYGSHIFSL